MDNNGIQKAGDVKIEQLKLVSTQGVVFDLTEFLIELNVYEDMFNNYLYGNLVLSDSRNLIENAPIIGEEYLILKVKTPSLEDAIQKTFRVFKVSDRNVVRDNNTQTFVVHFASIELFYDILLPLFVPFEGTVHDVAGEIFTNYISTSREFKISEDEQTIRELETNTPLVLLNETSNKVKFIAAGWSPFKCINWLASKALPKDGVAANFLFYESNKAFYFGSVEHLFKDVTENKNYIGTYYISAANIRDGSLAPNLNRDYFIAKNVEMVETTDHIKNYTNGYLANRLITLDVYNKKYELVDYDYVENYNKQYHTSGIGNRAAPVFTSDSLRNPATNISFYPINPKLYDSFPDNVNEKIKQIYGNRKSSLLDLTNLKLHMLIPGRTDIEVGRILYFSYPALGSAEEADKAGMKEDKQYSGYYLITAIHHKITKLQHMMSIEAIKDSIYSETK